MSGLCAYKDMLGTPGVGIHSHRIFNLAVVDVGMTIAGAGIISYYSGYAFINVLLILFILGIILHRVFCVDTTIDRLLSRIIPPG